MSNKFTIIQLSGDSGGSTSDIRTDEQLIDAYERKKADAAARQRNASQKARDIYPVPDIVNPARRNSCEHDLELFCKTYLPQTFYLPFGDVHKELIRKIEATVAGEGLFALACPRGSGKTSLCLAGCLWALVYGKHKFIALIGAEEMHAAEMLANIRAELEYNDLLNEDFPTICYPIRKLGGIALRAKGQVYNGVNTSIMLSAKKLVMPTLKGAKNSDLTAGSAVMVAGIEGRVRGISHKTHDGKNLRPSLVLIDDVQTDASAASASQTATRMKIVNGSILGLHPPDKNISALLSCTVIRKDDLADRLLNNKKYPHWQGSRLPLVKTWPTHIKLWQEYEKLWRQEMEKSGTFKQAQKFYKKNKKKMNEGAEVTWKDRHGIGELSAIQHAFNLKLQRGDEAFASEYQNEPLVSSTAPTEAMPADDILARSSGLPKYILPDYVEKLVCAIDVHDNILYYSLIGFGDNFTGHLVDYGAFPDQNAIYFKHGNLNSTLTKLYPRLGKEARIKQALSDLVDKLFKAKYTRTDGVTIPINLVGIDSGYATDVVYDFCKYSTYANNLIPVKGKGLGAVNMPMSEWRKQRGTKIGNNWVVKKGTSNIRYIISDTNFWKSFVFARLNVLVGDSGGLTFYGKATDHRMLVDHILSEEPVFESKNGRELEAWKLKPNCDNHYLDTVVMNFVLASYLGENIMPVAAAIKSDAKNMFASRFKVRK